MSLFTPNQTIKSNLNNTTSTPTLTPTMKSITTTSPKRLLNSSSFSPKSFYQKDLSTNNNNNKPFIMNTIEARTPLNKPSTLTNYYDTDSSNLLYRNAYANPNIIQKYLPKEKITKSIFVALKLQHFSIILRYISFNDLLSLRLSCKKMNQCVGFYLNEASAKINYMEANLIKDINTIEKSHYDSVEQLNNIKKQRRLIIDQRKNISISLQKLDTYKNLPIIIVNLVTILIMLIDNDNNNGSTGNTKINNKATNNNNNNNNGGSNSNSNNNNTQKKGKDDKNEDNDNENENNNNIEEKLYELNTKLNMILNFDVKNITQDKYNKLKDYINNKHMITEDISEYSRLLGLLFENLKYILYEYEMKCNENMLIKYEELCTKLNNHKKKNKKYKNLYKVYNPKIM